MLASSLDGGDDNGFAGAGEIAGKKKPDLARRSIGHWH